MGIISNAIKAKTTDKIKRNITHALLPASAIIPGNDPISKGINLLSIGVPVVLTGAFATVSPKLAMKFAVQYTALLVLCAIYCKVTGKPFWTFKQ